MDKPLFTTVSTRRLALSNRLAMAFTLTILVPCMVLALVAARPVLYWVLSVVIDVWLFRCSF